MIFSDLRSIRRDLADVVPMLKCFLTFNTDRLMDLSEGPKQSEDWDKSIILFAIYAICVLAYAIFIDSNNVPDIWVYLISLIVQTLIIICIVVLPMAIAFRWSMSRWKMSFLLNLLFLYFLAMVVSLCMATAWAAWPSHVRSDFYLFGRGAGQNTSVHRFVCGGLERQAAWIRITEMKVVDLEWLATRAPERDAGQLSGNAQSGGEIENQQLENEARTTISMEQNRANLMSIRDVIEEELFFQAYPSIEQALYGLSGAAILFVIFVYVHCFRAALSSVSSLGQRRSAWRSVLGSILATGALGWASYSLQHRSLPSMPSGAGPNPIAELKAALPAFRRELEDERNQLREQFERLVRYCPDVPNRGLWPRNDQPVSPHSNKTRGG